jgi:hypothetical protein
MRRRLLRDNRKRFQVEYHPKAEIVSVVDGAVERFGTKPDGPASAPGLPVDFFFMLDQQRIDLSQTLQRAMDLVDACLVRVVGLA